MATFLRPFSSPRFFLRGVFLTAEKPSAIILACVILASWMFSHAVIAGFPRRFFCGRKTSILCDYPYRRVPRLLDVFSTR